MQKIRKSHSISIFSFLLALNKFKEKGINEFKGITTDHRDTLELMQEALQIKYSKDEVKTFIADNAKDLNTILKKNGFDIQLDESKPFDLGVVTIMDLIGQWYLKAEPETVLCENKSYSAGLIKSGACVITNGEKETLMIRTRRGLCVFIQMDDTERSGTDLFYHVFKQARSLTHSQTPCDAIIPLVDLNHQPDMNWLQGIQSIDPPLVIDKVLQQNRLKITLDGIHAQSGTALGGVRGLITGRPQFVINSPFNIWPSYGDPELQYFPLFVAYVAPDSWKEPKS